MSAETRSFSQVLASEPPMASRRHDERSVNAAPDASSAASLAPSFARFPATNPA